ncbi:MAG: hypothetical protein AB7T10_06800 [bacterium]
MDTKILIVLFMVIIVASINPLKVFGEGIDNERSLKTEAEQNKDMPIKDKTLGRILKVCIVATNFLVGETLKIGAFVTLIGTTVFTLGLIGGELGNSEHSDMTPLLYAVLSVFVASGLTVAVLFIKHIVVSVEEIKKIFSD